MEESDTFDLQQKQTYLTQEVMKRGFDVQHFATFLSQKRQGGTDVNMWTMEELQKVKLSFKSHLNLGRI